ncbi:hypothetical protein VULLAG_LOCUS7668 [Vulpes lagopus]
MRFGVPLRSVLVPLAPGPPLPRLLERKALLRVSLEAAEGEHVDSFLSSRLPGEGLLGSRLVCVDKVPSSSTAGGDSGPEATFLPRGPPPMSLADQEALDPLPLIFSQAKTVSGSWTRRES